MENVLRVLHLPPQLSDERREELFKKYGANKTKTIRKSAKYTITFVEFPSHELAADAFIRLHQLEIKGKRLSIEFAKKNSLNDNQENLNLEKDNTAEENASKNKLQYQKFLKKLNNWAPHHIISQPIPPYLKYKYPAPTKNILLRIGIQLIKEPAFYTQVLHLMNKMNIPPPFEGLDEEFPMVKEAYDIENYQDLFDLRVNLANSKDAENLMEINEDLDEGESEIESDNDPDALRHIIPEKRKLGQSKKRMKIPKFVNPQKQNLQTVNVHHKQIKPEDVFEKIKSDETKSLKIKTDKIKTVNENTESRLIVKSSETEGFGLMFPTSKEETAEASDKNIEYISTDELAKNRVSANDQRVLPVFKNYHPGKPSCKLYIKNLAKHVEEQDLHFIYKRYVMPNSTGNESEYSVRLMQEGRMKGQAFVTFQNAGQAKLALEETNGYMLKEKPMVVQYAKVAKK